MPKNPRRIQHCYFSFKFFPGKDDQKLRDAIMHDWDRGIKNILKKEHLSSGKQFDEIYDFMKRDFQKTIRSSTTMSRVAGFLKIVVYMVSMVENIKVTWQFEFSSS